MPGAPEMSVYPAQTPLAAILVAHGAGAGRMSPFMVQVAEGFAGRGISAATFDFPYVTAKRKVPDRAPVLEASWREAIAAARTRFGDLPLAIGGKSMGGRIASHVAAQGYDNLLGLVFLGYPLHPPGRPDQKRDAHLPQIREPMLFVQGTRDAFGTSDEIRALMPRLQRATLHVVDGGDHSFKVTGARKGEGALPRILDVVTEWIRGLTRP